MEKFSLERALSLESKYDDSLQTRPIGDWLAKFVLWFSVLFALYHYVTAGIGVPVDYWHMGAHMSGVIILIFISFPAFKRLKRNDEASSVTGMLSGVPFYDWLFMVVGVASSLYVGVTWYGVDLNFLGFSYSIPEQVLRMGVPLPVDVVFGTLLILVLLEAVRRTIGIVVPIIILFFIGYAVLGPYIPLQILKHPGLSWSLFVNNMYFPDLGIYGVTLWIVSTVVFHFVLFGVLAQRIGLGQFFVDLATVAAGRYTGGLAKVSVVSSALFGTISGSSIANTVSTGSLTIPNMKKSGYPGHFAGGVESAASAGGQITPPIMGAAAFVLAEFLEIPYSTVVIAAAVPAAMHYIGVMSIVHFKAKKLGLKGLSAEQIPQFIEVIKRGWMTAIPLIVLINPRHRIGLGDLIAGASQGVKYALSVGAVCAAIGIVVGVVNATGLGFRLGFMVTNSALGMGESILPLFSLIPFADFTLNDITLFISLVLIAVTCILMGAGLPTTALYVMLATVAQPALANLGIPPLASHLFVLYYGVISEITPPVCASAYAAAGIAGSNPFRTGLSAFSLGIGKLLVPMVFVYSPAMLIVLDDYFTWQEFLHTVITCGLGVFLLSASVAGYFLANMNGPSRALFGIAGIFLVAPSFSSTLYAAFFAAPVLVMQVLAYRRRTVPEPAE
ncbi:MAG: TRAP transporter fused permease subunit [Rhodobiaceae bacterium]